MPDLAPFLLLALGLAAIVTVFWFASRRGKKQQEGDAAAKQFRTIDVAVLASSVTIRTVLERTLRSAGIPFNFVEITPGVTPVLPEAAKVAILNVNDLTSAGLPLLGIISQRPAVCLIRPFTSEGRELPTGPGILQLSKPFTPEALFLALASAVGTAQS